MSRLLLTADMFEAIHDAALNPSELPGRAAQGLTDEPDLAAWLRNLATDKQSVAPSPEINTFSIYFPF